VSADGHAAGSFDGVRLALMNNRFQGVVRSMMNTLYRTGRSGVLNTAKDFSCCILTAGGELLATAESLPIHVMSGPDLAARWMQHWYPELRRGDAFFHNSPYQGNSHPADHSMLVPVIDDDGVHRFTVFGKAHQADCGNSTPTTYMATARDVYEEGALIFPCVKVQEDYRDRDDVIRMCKLRIRVPEQWWGDYLALLGAVRIGERRMLELGGELGWDALEDYTREWFDYSEERMIQELRGLPSARLTAETAHDPFPGVPDGIPLSVTVEVKSDDALIEVDLRDNPDCQPCGLNLTEATARTAAMVGIFNSIDHTVPPNAGSFRRLRIHLRENCCVGIPRHPFSCSVATTNLADRVTNAVQRALAELGVGVGMAEIGLVIPPAAAVISGLDARTNERFVNQLILSALTGGPGGPAADGWLLLATASNSGMMTRDSVELDELRFPIRIIEQRIIADTEGAGRHRGSPGAYCEYAPIGGVIEVMYVSDGSVRPATGAVGGLPGAPARQYRREPTGELSELDACGHVFLEPGTSIVSISCGGGGYGPPRLRDPARVRHDVVEGWVTRERASAVYGVVVDETGDVDVEATEALRARTGEELAE
jgi:N-methylhydantoinase B